MSSALSLGSRTGTAVSLPARAVVHHVTIPSLSPSRPDGRDSRRRALRMATGRARARVTAQVKPQPTSGRTFREPSGRASPRASSTSLRVRGKYAVVRREPRRGQASRIDLRVWPAALGVARPRPGPSRGVAPRRALGLNASRTYNNGVAADPTIRSPPFTAPRVRSSPDGRTTWMGRAATRTALTRGQAAAGAETRRRKDIVNRTWIAIVALLVGGPATRSPSRPPAAAASTLDEQLRSSRTELRRAEARLDVCRGRSSAAALRAHQRRGLGVYIREVEVSRHAVASGRAVVRDLRVAQARQELARAREVGRLAAADRACGEEVRRQRRRPVPAHDDGVRGQGHGRSAVDGSTVSSSTRS